jgi:RHH-type transcriptional regulator, rel operon repressor / antitoxin RelB
MSRRCHIGQGYCECDPEFTVPLLTSIRLDKNLDARLERLARLTGRSKSFYVNQAVEEQIRMIEDRFVARRAAQHASDGRERVVPLYELECALGLDD